MVWSNAPTVRLRCIQIPCRVVEERFPVIRAAAQTMFALGLIAAACAPQVSASSATQDRRVPVYRCSVSSDPSPADFSVPAGAVPLGLAMADFTGDSHPDLATLKIDRLDSSRAYYVIEIQLTEGGRQSLKLTAPPRSLVLTPVDVTGDGTLDLVVHGVGSNVPVAVFLNDGCGHFSAKEPARYTPAIQEIPAGADYSSMRVRFDSAAVGRGASATDSQGQAVYSRQGPRHRCFLAWEGAPAERFLPLRTDRAPPATA
jgi:hypothetical protein